MDDQPETDAAFHRRREQQERAAADAASCLAKDAHLDMADAHAELIADDDDQA